MLWLIALACAGKAEDAIAKSLSEGLVWIRLAPPPPIPILLMSLADNILIFQDWTVTVVEDPMKNAFVLPSGNIFVFTGMLEVIIIYFT